MYLDALAHVMKEDHLAGCARSFPKRVRRAADVCPGHYYAYLVQRHLLGLLFMVLAAGLFFIAVYAARHGGAAWVIALASGALAVWMADLARRVLARRRA